jgi:hypothetical protein
MLVAFALALNLFSADHSAASSYNVKNWRVEVVRDTFLGATTCRVSKRNVVVDRNALVLRLGANIDTADAYFRIDDGIPIPAYEARSPWSAATSNLGNPSAGIVEVPFELLQHAPKKISVRASRHALVRTFDISALDEALGTARRLSCS